MPRYLALDWDEGRLLLVSATASKTGATIERALGWPEAEPPSAANAEAIGQRLKNHLKDASIAAAPLVIAVPRERLVLKEIRFPAVPLHEEPGIVRFQAIKELSDSDDVVIDYQTSGSTETGGERKALAAALKKNLLATYQTLAKAAGLKLVGVAPRAFGALAAAQRSANPPGGSATIAVLTLGRQGGEFVIGRDEHVAFARSVAAQALAADAALVADVRRNLAVYSGAAAGHPVQALYVAEDAGTQVAERLRAALTIPVHSLGGADAGAVAASAGLLHVFAATRTLPINFVHPREPKQPRDPNKRMLAWAGGIAAALLLGLAILGWARLSAQDREIRDLQDARSQLDRDLVFLDQDDRRFKAVKDWQDSEVVWLDELYDLTAATPNIDRMRFTHIVGNPIAIAAGAGKNNKYAARVELKGLVTDDTKPLIALTRELDVDGFHRVEAKTTAPNTGGNRRQFLQQWSTKFDVEKRLDPADTRAASRYDRKFTATPPARRRSGTGFDFGILGGLIP